MNRTFRTFSVVAAALLLSSSLARNANAGDDHVGYAVTKKGEFSLPESLEGVNDKHLVMVRWGDYQGPRRRVAVLPVSNDSSAGTFQMTGPGGQSYSFSGMNMGGGSGPSGSVPVNGIEAMITDSLARSGRFRLVERVEVDEVMAEQELASGGRTTAQSGADTGKILGAEYLVQAVVTSYEPNFKGKKGGLGGFASKLTGGASMGKSKSLVGMNFRLIDAETTEIMFTRQIDVITTASKFDMGGSTWGSSSGLSGFLSSYSSTPVGQAVMAAVNRGVFELIKQIGATPVAGSVIKIDGERIFLNLGSDVIAMGDVLDASKPGEEMIDPDTGLSLGGDAEAVGKVQIVECKEKYAVAKALGFDAATLSRGDRLVATGTVTPLRFATTWEGPKK